MTHNAYFDCFAGASGDMILGALLDAGLPFNALKAKLDKLPLTNYSLSAEKGTKNGISGTSFHVEVGHDHRHRSLGDIVGIINKSGLSDEIKADSLRIFTRLAEAEAKIHNKPVDEVHFHEVGAVDSIVDIVGAVISLSLLDVGRITASLMRIGTGTLECAHGVLPVPAPATAELIKGFPVESTGIENELTTPTGAAILTTLAKDFGPMPSMTLERTGYGLGGRDLTIPNILRVMIGRENTTEDSDTVQLIETNIDDMNPQFYEYIMEVLFAAGAKDVFLTPVIMKKNRPGVVLSVSAEPEKTDAMVEVIFRETTTLGVRLSDIKKRIILSRRIETVSTPWGEACVKIRTEQDGTPIASPEYDDCKKLAQEQGIPIRTVYDAVKRLGQNAADKGSDS